jgi:hypothetical protein
MLSPNRAASMRNPGRGRPEDSLSIVEIPAKIRALAKVVHDADDFTFRDLRDSDGKLKDGPLNELILALGYTITPTERKQFGMAYEEYALQLMGVDLSTVAKNRASEALKLTTAIESEATMAGISLLHSFDAIGHAHTFMISIVAVEVPSAFQEVFDLLMHSVSASLQEVLKVLKGRSDQRRGALEKDTQRILAQRNANVWFAIQHLEWYLEQVRWGLFYDVTDHLEDRGAARFWVEEIGRKTPALPASKFEPALKKVFPTWAHEPLMLALNYLDDGVVSVFSLRRMLAFWGPFSLLAENLAQDLTKPIISLRRPTELAHVDLQHSNKPGEFCVTFGRQTGTLVVQFTTVNGVRAIPFDRSVGCFTLPALSGGDFETIADAIRSVSDLFITPTGDAFNIPKLAVHSDSIDSCSIMHRACYQNNLPYVCRLLGCGGSLTLNTAEVDPCITSEFAWPPLMCAVNNPLSDPFEVAEVLLSNGADPTFCDRAKCTALYYAIVNGYPKTVRVLLQRCPTLQTSSTSTNIFLAIGANLFNGCERDNRRVAELVPNPHVIRELLLHVRDAQVLKFALQILCDKLEGKVTEPPEDWDFRGAILPLLTEEQRKANLETVIEHGKVLRERKHRTAVEEVIRLLRMHAFFLSCQQLMKDLQAS